MTQKTLEAPGWYCTCGDFNPTWKRLDEHIHAVSHRGGHWWDQSRGQQNIRPNGELCVCRGCQQDLGGQHVMGVVEECCYFNPRDRGWDDDPALTLRLGREIADQFANPGYERADEVIGELKSIYESADKEVEAFKDAITGPSSITITTTKGTEMQIKIGQTVHAVNTRRGACNPAMVVQIPMIEDPDNEGRMTPDAELGTLQLQIFGMQAQTAIYDYEPTKPSGNSWHSLEECTNEFAAVDVVER